MSRAYLGLGSNLGDRLANLAEALRRIEALPETWLLGVSHVYESVAWPSEEDPPYANAVALVDTRLEAVDLLGLLKDAEREMGRDMAAAPNAPRVVDLDILLVGDEEWVRADLTVPHPRMAERDFVITPLLELAPDAEYPDGTPVTRDRVRYGRVARVLGPVPGFADRAPAGETPERPAVPPSPRRVRTPLPGDEWVEVFRHPTESGEVGAPPSFVTAGWRPSVEASFAQVVLEQEGIPFAWDPFPPEDGADPYNFRRPFRLLVPASMLEEARRAIDEAGSAPFDFSEAYELAEAAEPAAGGDEGGDAT